MALFTAAELGDFLGTTVTEERGTAIERVVWGWLKPVLGLDERPSTIPDDVFSWALELGGIAYRNPSGLKSAQLGPGMVSYGLERREAILAEAAASGPVAALRPRGSFPAAQSYPDPAW